MIAFQDEPAFIIHKRPYNDRSDLIQFLTPEYGRITVIARSSVKMIGKVLEPFIPVNISCGGRGQIPGLRQLEPEGVQILTTAGQRMVGMYINELLAKLTPAHSASRSLFHLYSRCITELGEQLNENSGGQSDTAVVEKILRNFEIDLLELVGNGLQLQYECGSMQPIEADAHYRYDVGHGPRLANGGEPQQFVYAGETLIAARERFTRHHPQVMLEAKYLMRQVVDHHLGNKTIETRRLFSYLQSMV